MKAKACIASLALLLSFVLQGNAEATVISYNDFSSSSGYTLAGGSTQVDRALKLTQKGTTNAVGGVFFDTPVDINHFTTSFTFEFSQDDGADGLMFVIKNPGSVGGGENGLGGYGEQMGYANRYDTKGIMNSVGVEFDTHKNDAQGDSDNNHIGINRNGSVTSLTQLAIASDFNSGNTWYAWVDYHSGKLSVSTNQTGIRPDSPMLFYSIDLEETIGSTVALMGFTAATGSVTQTTRVKSFNYSPNPEPSTYVLMGIGALVAAAAAKSRKVC